MSQQPTKIGILGCGVISGIYIENSKKLDAIELAAIADVNPTAARYRADQYGIERALSPDELLADPEIEIVINLTPNRLHAQISTQILEAGKHAYSEKPLTVYREEAQRLLATATKLGRRVGSAPDTFFGGAWQTARKAIDDGLIGQPFGGMAVFHGRRTGAAQEGRPPPSSPTRTPAPGHVQFFQTEGFKYGVTVAFDMGPYYLHALINLLGPARRVVGATRKVFDEQLRMGSPLKVEAPTHAMGMIEFANPSGARSGPSGAGYPTQPTAGYPAGGGGPLVHFLVTSDVYGTGLPHLEIYGTEGSLRLPDPNYFPGPVLLRTSDSPELVELECKHSYNQDSRGVGVADMAVAIKTGRPHRAHGDMGAHVVDILNAIHESSDTGHRIDLATTCPQPKPLPVGLPNWSIDADSA